MTSGIEFLKYQSLKKYIFPPLGNDFLLHNQLETLIIFQDSPKTVLYDPIASGIRLFLWEREKRRLLQKDLSKAIKEVKHILIALIKTHVCIYVIYSLLLFLHFFLI